MAQDIEDAYFKILGRLWGWPPKSQRLAQPGSEAGGQNVAPAEQAGGSANSVAGSVVPGFQAKPFLP